MDTSVAIDYGKVPGLLKRMRDNEGLKAGLPAAASYMRDQVAIYAPVRRQRQPPKTDKQRRFLHWAIRTGVIQVPYRRTGGMARAWRITYAPDRLSATITNSTTAARYTKHPAYQASYHRGNWRTAEEDVRRYAPEAVRRAGVHVGISLEPR